MCKGLQLRRVGRPSLLGPCKKIALSLHPAFPSSRHWPQCVSPALGHGSAIFTQHGASEVRKGSPETQRQAEDQ